MRYNYIKNTLNIKNPPVGRKIKIYLFNIFKFIFKKELWSHVNLAVHDQFHAMGKKQFSDTHEIRFFADQVSRGVVNKTYFDFWE